MKRKHGLSRSFLAHLPTLALCSAAACAAALGCQAEPDRGLGWTTDSKGERLQSVPAESTLPFLAPLADFAGRWRGSAEDPLALGGPASTYRFPSGATTIILDLSVNDAGNGVGGTIAFGDETPPAPPTDADKGYPEGASYSRLAYMTGRAFNASYYAGPLPPLEGFTYRVGEVSSAITEPTFPSFGANVQRGLADGVLSLAYSPNEPLAPWCELQVPFVHSDGIDSSYSCLEGGATFTDDGRCSIAVDNSAEVYGALGPGGFEALSPEEQLAISAQIQVLSEKDVDCDKVFLCSTDRCTCDAVSCSVNSPTYASLTLRRDGDGLVGIVGNGAVFENARHLLVPIGALHFVREE